MSKKRYRIRFDAEGCIGAGRCTEEAPEHWTLDLNREVARPLTPTFGEQHLEAQLRAARACPARNGRGVIRIEDRESGDLIS